MCLKQYMCCKKKKSISLLLGAGFSAPMGYPIGNELNNKLLNCANDNIAFDRAGELRFNKNGRKIDFGKGNPYEWYFSFCKDMIRYYNNIKEFDYEEFYDYYKEQKKKKDDVGLEELFDKSDYPKFGIENFDSYLFNIDGIYNQLVAFYLKDKDGKSWYDDEPMRSKPTFEGYTGFLNCIEELAKNHVINVHTLNHDLFFERLNNTEWIKGEICDGFEELGSPFYGELQHDNRTYKCRLSKYTGNYDKNIRLYKLHGSMDYHNFYSAPNGIARLDGYIKTRYGIGPSNCCKETKDRNGNLVYEENHENSNHPNFLTGKDSKIIRYKSDLYKKLFEQFKKNLNEAEILIIIGYGCNDDEINKIIMTEFGKNKLCYIVNPYPNKEVYDFISQMGKNTDFVRGKEKDKIEFKKIADIELSDFKVFLK